jgi:LytR cell envelope-related transcriptional attenuator
MAMPIARGGIGALIHRSAARGAALIGAAVIIGIVLLQVIDDSGVPGGGTPDTPVTNNGTTATTASGEDGRPPQEVRVLVLNGSSVNMAAATKANELRGLGYSITGTGNAAVRAGTAVGCKEGFSKEADQLAKTVGAGTGTVTVEAFPSPPPENSENADCVVIIGQ